MTEKEFAEKVVSNKAFRKEVMGLCYDYKPATSEESTMGKLFNYGANKMGLKFDTDQLNAEIENRLKSLSGFKKIVFFGSLINIARKAKKADEAGK